MSELADDLERLHEALKKYGRPSPEVGALAYALVDAAPEIIAALRWAERAREFLANSIDAFDTFAPPSPDEMAFQQILSDYPGGDGASEEGE